VKKIVAVFLLVMGVCVFGGCSSKNVVTDISSLGYLDSSSKENIAYNLEMVAKKIKSFNFNGSITNKGKRHDFNGKVIVGATIEDSLIHITYKENNLYFKNGNVYLSYFYNNTNVVIKDSVDNYVKEIATLLEEKVNKYNEDKILNIIKNKKIDDIDFLDISEYVSKQEDHFNIEYKGFNMEVNDKYLPTKASYSKNKLIVSVNFNYEPVSIGVPVGYDLINMSIRGIKDLLDVEDVRDIIK